MPINKVIYGDTTLIDLTQSSLDSASQILQGTTAFDRAGNLLTGTATSGGGGSGFLGITQDENGYLILEEGALYLENWIEQTIPDDGAVTQELDPYVLYHFTGELTALTITLGTPDTGQLAHYHFDFDCGATAPTVTIPNTVTMPDTNSFDANKHYEVDILNDYGTVQSWVNS